MEQVAVGKMTEYSRYGSNQQKRMFIYGRLDTGPTILSPSYGFGWTLSGWLLFPFIQSINQSIGRNGNRGTDAQACAQEPDDDICQPLQETGRSRRDADQGSRDRLSRNEDR